MSLNTANTPLIQQSMCTTHDIPELPRRHFVQPCHPGLVVEVLGHWVLLETTAAWLNWSAPDFHPLSHPPPSSTRNIKAHQGLTRREARPDLQPYFPSIRKEATRKLMQKLRHLVSINTACAQLRSILCLFPLERVGYVLRGFRMH